MCGIWGAIHAVREEQAQAAAAAMRHRGPDDFGVFYCGEPQVALVNTRLAILDLSPAGHQPMYSPDGRYVIVYNGESYNFREVRPKLEALGISFNSDSDTEVILRAYEQWGPDCLHEFRGMFAIAIWDQQEQRLFLARDRMGVKPIYYLHEGGRFAFASELKALIASGMVRPRLRMEALHHYLAFYAVPTPFSILEGVLMLPPGHYLLFEAGRVSLTRYWDIPADEPLGLTEREIIGEVRRLLEESIRLRMVSDVQVGAFLSGGLDSSAVLALMTRISGDRLRSFSIGFDEAGAGMDERSAARLMAQHYGSDHSEVIVTGAQVRDELPAIIRAMDQPTGDGLNTYLVSQATAKHVKVALSGLGGDELFAGYPQYRLFQRADQAAWLWKQMPRTARAVARDLPIESVQRAIPWLEGDIMERYSRVRVLFSEEERQRLYSPSTRAGMGEVSPSLHHLGQLLNPTDAATLAQLTRLELRGYMTHTLLRDTDVMSMAHSLEARVPLIDHKLVEFAVRIPAEMKLRGRRSKWVFAEALRDLVPAEVIRRPKRGFEMPVAAWMRAELRPMLEDVFSTESIRARGLFEPQPLRTIYEDFQAGHGPYMRAWAFAALELWMRATLD